MAQTPEIMIDGEVIVFDYYHTPEERESSFPEYIEINAIYENDIELNEEEHKSFMMEYDENKICKMILSGSTIYE